MPSIRVCVFILFALAVVPTLHAQGAAAGAAAKSSSESGKSDGAGEGMESLSEVFESGLSLFIDAIQPEEEKGEIDDPRHDSLASPQDAVLTFLEAMDHVEMGRTAAWPRALKPFGEDTETNRQAARDLKAVFDRLGKVAPTDLPGPERVRQDAISRYEVFPFGLDHEWVFEQLGAAPAGSVVVEAQGGRWLFAKDTVDGAADLLESMKSLPPQYERDVGGRLFLGVIEPVFQRTPWWSWLMLALCVAAGVGVGWLCKVALDALAAKMTDGRWRLARAVVTSLAMPAMLLAVTIGLTVGLAYIELTPTLAGLRLNLIELLLIVAVVWLLYGLVDLAAELFQAGARRTESQYDDMAVVMLRRLTRAVLLALAAILILQNVFGWNVTALLAGLGILGLALSLAGKDWFANLFGALIIFGNRQFMVGDWVVFKGYVGEILDVGMQVTKLRKLSGESVFVPNMHFIDTELENMSLRHYLRRTLDVAITYDTPPEKIDEAIGILEDILDSDEVAREGLFDLDQKPGKVNFDRFGEDYLNLRVDYWYYMAEDRETVQRDSDRGWFSYLGHCSLVDTRIVERFNEAGIDFAFPTRTLYLASDPDRRLAIESRTTEGRGDSGR